MTPIITADFHRSTVASRVQRGVQSRDATPGVAVLVGVLPPGVHRTREGVHQRGVCGGVLGSAGGMQPDREVLVGGFFVKVLRS